jgi:selenocysteine-specific translation elongation factor
VLVIDEAQNLSAEVLEQLRLLTNLETGRAQAAADRADRPARAARACWPARSWSSWRSA